MKRQSALAFAVALLGLVGGASCADSAMPGTTLGTYKVTAQSQNNTCGLGAPDPWSFDVQLSQDGTTLYWSWLDGSALVSGTTGTPTAMLTSEVEGNVDATDAGPGPCTMIRNDDIDVSLASGAQPSSFTGTIVYSFVAVANSNCSDQLAAGGGQYSALPCSITYSMAGSRQ